MTTVAVGLVTVWVGFAVYAYAGYPLLLRLLAALLPGYCVRREDPDPWPKVSVSLPAYNEEQVIAETLEALLAVDYPRDRLQIVVVSDASTDRTDEIVRSFADRGVELVRLDERGGKTAAENAAVPHLTGEVVVNTDASTRIPEKSLKPLVRAFRDPTVGVASGRDRSLSREEASAVGGESRYVAYEMAIRELETLLGGIVGASGCFYAIRRDLHDRRVSEWLDRDFMAALRARESGLRAVSVADAVALVPSSRSLADEFGRKARTMSRGLRTLWTMRHLLNPLQWGRFAWMLFSHKVARWAVPLLLPGAAVGLSWLSLQGSVTATAVLSAGGLLGGVGVVAVRWGEQIELPKLATLCGYAMVAMSAGLAAWWGAVHRERETTWTPTRRREAPEP